MKKNILIHLITPVWGEDYTKTFVGFSFPSLLNEKQLEILKKNKNINCIYRIYTTKKDAFFIKKSQIYKMVSEYIPIEFIMISEVSKKEYDIMNFCFNEAIKEAYKVDAVVTFLNSDIVYSNNYLNTICLLLQEGYRAICTVGIRLAKQSFINFIKNNYKQLDFTPRQLAKVALKFLHPSMNYLFWDSKKVTKYCSHMLWRIDSNNILVRGFHLHPIVFWPDKKVTLTSNCDGYIIKEIPFEKIKVIQDSDEGIIFELTNQNLFVHGNLRKRSKSYLAKWGTIYADSIHWRLIRKKIYIKSNERKLFWDETEKKSDKIVLQIEGLKRFIIIGIFFENTLGVILQWIKKSIKKMPFVYRFYKLIKKKYRFFSFIFLSKNNIRNKKITK